MDRPFFLDTSVILAAILGTSRPASRLVFSSGWDLHTIEYALKETGRVLRKRYHFPEPKIAEAIDHVRRRVVVHRTPPAIRFGKLDIRDKSDRPIVYAARMLGCVLIIDDEETYRDALAYVEAVRLDDL
jgi:predicted nucleic acid-binding protein